MIGDASEDVGEPGLGSTSLRRAVTIRELNTAALSPPASDPAKVQFCGREPPWRGKIRSELHSPGGPNLRNPQNYALNSLKNQTLTRSVLNPAVISFGENWPQIERFGPLGACTGQQVLREKPTDIGLFVAVAGMRRRSSMVWLAEGVGFEPTVRLHAQQFSRLS